MRKLLEAVLAAAILVVGASVAIVLTDGLPDTVEGPARQVTQALGIDRLIAADEQAAPAAERRGGERGGGRGGGTVITAQPVRLEPLVDRIQAVGTGQATESVIVATSVAGLVETIHFTSNAVVEKGDPLVTLDRAAQAIAVESAKAQFAQAQAVNERYQASGKRSGTFSAAQIEEVATALSVAQAALQEAQFEYDRRVIRAPFAGRVGLKDVSVGQHLPAGAEIVRLDNTSALQIEFLVPESKAASARAGAPVRAMSLALTGEAFEGEIDALDSHIDATTRTLRVRALIPNRNDVLTPGMTFSITVPIEGAPMPIVPALSIQWSREGAFVWRIRDTGVERVPVVIAKREGDDVYVEAKLAEGDLVAVEGAQKLNPGSTVSVQPAPEPGDEITVEAPALRIQTDAAAASAVQVTR